MSENAAEAPSVRWLTMPDLVEVLGEPLGRVRQILAEQYLVGSSRNGAFSVPDVFIVNSRPLPSLRGTIIALSDAGFSDDETIDWLFTEEEELGRTPIAALLDGHKSAVRRVARALG